MASLQHIKQGWQTGYRLRVWTGGKRHSVWLGPVREREAKTVLLHVEAIVQSEKLSTPLPTETQRWLRDLSTDLRRRLKDVLGTTKTVDEAVDLYIAHCDATCKESTSRGKEDTLSQLASHLGSIPLQSLTGELIERWIDRQNVAASTVGKHVRNIRAWLNWCLDQRLIDSKPTINYASTIGVGKKVYINADRIQSVIDHFSDDPEMQAVLALSRWCGLRVASELVTLRRSSVDVAAERIKIQDAKRSLRQSRGPPVIRDVPLFKGLRPYLMKLLSQPGRPMDYLLPTIGGMHPDRAGGVLRQRVYRAFDELGIERWPRVFHSLRATRQTELIASVGQKAACDWIGNTSEVARRAYELIPDETYARGVDA